MTGSGSRAVVAKLTPADLAAAHAASIRPDTARIVVVGDVDKAAAVAALDRAFGDWAAPATPAATKAFDLAIPEQPPPIVLIDRPGAPQSGIAAGRVLPATGTDAHHGLQAQHTNPRTGYP